MIDYATIYEVPFCVVLVNQYVWVSPDYNHSEGEIICLHELDFPSLEMLFIFDGYLEALVFG